jgi:hypothetical protein
LAFVKLGSDSKSPFSARIVPLHPALLEAGLQTFIESKGPGALFLETPDPREAVSILRALNRAMATRTSSGNGRSGLAALRRRLQSDLRMIAMDPNLVREVLGRPPLFDYKDFGASFEYALSVAHKSIASLPRLDQPHPDSLL